MLKYLLLIVVGFQLLSAQYSPARNDTVDQHDSLHIAPEMKKQIYDPWFACDKVLHFSAGFAIPGLTYHFYVNRLNRDEQRGKVYAVSLTALLAVGKVLHVCTLKYFVSNRSENLRIRKKILNSKH